MAAGFLAVVLIRSLLGREDCSHSSHLFEQKVTWPPREMARLPIEESNVKPFEGFEGRQGRRTVQLRRGKHRTFLVGKRRPVDGCDIRIRNPFTQNTS